MYVPSAFSRRQSAWIPISSIAVGALDKIDDYVMANLYENRREILLNEASYSLFVKRSNIHRAELIDLMRDELLSIPHDDPAFMQWSWRLESMGLLKSFVSVRRAPSHSRHSVSDDVLRRTRCTCPFGA